MQSDTEVRYMRRALALARRGAEGVRPNPMVGAVIVKEGSVIACGWHQRAGGPHAEVIALEAAGDNARGATMYVTLEPCTHYGRTGPCSEALLKAAIGKVVIGCRDPNPSVSGSGAERLREGGVEVAGPVLEPEARELNASWLHWIRTGKPLVYGLVARDIGGNFGAATPPSSLARKKLFFHANAEQGALVYDRITVRFANADEAVEAIIASGKQGVQSVLVEDADLTAEMLEREVIDRLVVVHTTQQLGAHRQFNDIDAQFNLLRVRRIGNLALSVYERT